MAAVSAATWIGGSMGAQEVKTGTVSDEEKIVAAITLAFVADPPVRWVYPGSRQYIDYFPQFVRAFGGTAFKHDSAYYAKGYSGAALWLPPGVHPDEEALDRVLERSLGSRKAEVLTVLNEMGSYHPPEPHWYLPLIGVDPRYQGGGIGSALLAHTLALCDRDKRPAYLESTNPRNNRLYQRYGFELLGTIDAAGCPPIFPMIRKSK
jgi:ribosomal protein S18 acetylase RimI-like enzyme